MSSGEHPHPADEYAVSLPPWHRNSQPYRQSLSTSGPVVRNFSYPSSIFNPLNNQDSHFSSRKDTREPQKTAHAASRSVDFANAVSTDSLGHPSRFGGGDPAESLKDDRKLEIWSSKLPTTPPSQAYARLKRLSLGHKRNLSLDAGGLFQKPEEEYRPASSCGHYSPDANDTNTTGSSPNPFASSRARPRLRTRRSTIMFPSSPSTPQETQRPVNQRTSSNSFKSGYDSSLSGDELRAQAIETRAIQSQNRGSKMRWFSQVKDWLSVSEPSAEAMKAQQSKTSKRHGIDMKDSKSVSKFHSPSAKLPPNVTTSTAGPTPEKALKKTLKERQLRQSFSNASAGTPSLSSRDSYSPSVKDSRRGTPWTKDV